MNQHVPRFIRELQPVDTCHHGGLQAVRLATAVIPNVPPTQLVATLPHPTMVPLAAALAGGAASVTELGDGDVGRLRVRNRSTALLFGMAGELIVGGRQDRVLNSSVLIAPGATVPVAVSCIERNRWDRAGRNRAFTSAAAGATASPAVRSAVHGTMITNLTRTGLHHADQSEVWRKVSDTLHRTGTHAATPTSTLAGGMAHHAARLDAYAQACATVHPDPNTPQLGLALFTPGTPSAGFHGFASIDCFASPVLMQHYAPRLVRGAALEAADDAPVHQPLVPPPDATRHLLAALADQRPVTIHPAAGEAPNAQELHYCFDGIVASVLCHQDRPIHLAISPVEEATASPAPDHRDNRDVFDGNSHFYNVNINEVIANNAPSKSSAQRYIGYPSRTTYSQTSRTQQAMFRVQGPDHSTSFIRLSHGIYTVGRSRSCDIYLDYETVSRTHLRLDISPSVVVVRDLRSTNGVNVNDQPILLAELEPLDRIALSPSVELQLLRKPE